MTKEEPQKSKTLNIALWVLQVVLAGIFLMTGIMKFAMTIEEQRSQLEWPKHVSGELIHFAGFMEIMCALGLLLPSLLRIKPLLTPLAAAGLGLIMILATCLNVSVGETKAVVPLLSVAAIALFLAWGRFRKVPISQK